MAKGESAMYVLEAMNGPQDGKRWEFEHNIVIGRDAGSAQASLPVDHAVSRVHARIDTEPDRLVIADLNSSNGTILGGQPISCATQLNIGEPFVVGRTMLRVLREKDSPANSTDV
ncbi:MAG: FHA domain-containing protein [Candidatus Eremiobacteraeota bacterium]|nr:FHA domain-containing protein [Candidatus Eremiobacteraeota bacterium]